LIEGKSRQDAGAVGQNMANSEAYSSKGACTKTAKMVAVAGGFEFQVED
jgi:hypothetical protein